MGSEDLVHTWKDPERRAGATVADHPAGEIRLDTVGGNATGLACISSLVLECPLTVEQTAACCIITIDPIPTFGC
jgi:hypothetical protein